MKSKLGLYLIYFPRSDWLISKLTGPVCLADWEESDILVTSSESSVSIENKHLDWKWWVSGSFMYVLVCSKPHTKLFPKWVLVHTAAFWLLSLYPFVLVFLSFLLSSKADLVNNNNFSLIFSTVLKECIN